MPSKDLWTSELRKGSCNWASHKKLPKKWLGQKYKTNASNTSGINFKALIYIFLTLWFETGEGNDRQTTSVFLPWEFCEQCEKAKRYDNRR